MSTPYYAAYVPTPTHYCTHPDIVNQVTDSGIALGVGGELVSIPVSGRDYRLAKVMCRRCGNVGGALPLAAVIDGKRLLPAALPNRDDRRPERLPAPARPIGIPTTYSGTNFRSRLEARWAAFFDLIGWSWVYEPLDAEGWIPDFLINGPAPFLVEVGPCVTEEDFRSKSAKPLSYLDRPTLVVGISPLVLVADVFAYAGYLVNEWPDVAAHAFWTITENGRLEVYQDSQIHYPDAVTWAECRHLSTAQEVRLNDLWADAGNKVQWQPR